MPEHCCMCNKEYSKDGPWWWLKDHIGITYCFCSLDCLWPWVWNEDDPIDYGTHT